MYRLTTCGNVEMAQVRFSTLPFRFQIDVSQSDQAKQEAIKGRVSNINFSPG